MSHPFDIGEQAALARAGRPDDAGHFSRHKFQRNVLGLPKLVVTATDRDGGYAEAFFGLAQALPPEFGEIADQAMTIDADVLVMALGQAVETASEWQVIVSPGQAVAGEETGQMRGFALDFADAATKQVLKCGLCIHDQTLIFLRLPSWYSSPILVSPRQ